MRSTLFHALSCLLLGLLNIQGSEAQPPAFEVASIKPNQDFPVMTIGPELRNGTLNGSKVTLRQLLAVAYGMSEPRIIGPEWMDRNRFDIVAKSPQGVPDRDMKPMLRALLKERFRLQAHLETRETPVYYLDVAKDGVKMPVYPAHDRAPNRPGDDPNIRGFPMMRGTFTTTQFADALARVVGRPVIDRTGLTQRYNLFLSYAPLSPQVEGQVPEFGPPDLFTSVQKQLGLRLQAGRDDVDIVLVDHIEQMPTAN